MKNFGNNDLIRYDRLVQDALRGVVQRVIEEIAAIGYLPSNHHFYITFQTNAPGVQLSKSMKEKYPKEITIIIQHQYWALKTYNGGFSLTLSFDAKPEHIKIPYTAISGFYDPSVEFGLQFEEATSRGDTSGGAANDSATSGRATNRNATSGGATSRGATVGEKVASLNPFARKVNNAKNKDVSTEDKNTEENSDGDNVISIDKFRKK